MAQKRIFCRDTDREVIIFVNLWEDEKTGLEYLKGLRCPHQSKCEYFNRKTLCPAVVEIQKKYSLGS